MKVGLIGAGTMGMTLAYRLADAGHRVTVLEAAPQMGGLATWMDYGDFVWDQFYHVICPTDSHLLGLMDDLGISSRVQWAQTKTGFLWKGQHLSMSNHWEFLTFPALSLLDKARLGLGILYCQRISDPAPLEKIRAVDWLTRIFGTAVYQTLWEPLLESKYGVVKERMPATIIWATIKRYFSTRSKGDGKENLGYVSGGLKTLFDALRQAVVSRGGTVWLSKPAQRIDATPKGVTVDCGEESLTFDRVISTVPSAQLKAMAPEVEGLFLQGVGTPEFLGVLCLTLITRWPLSPFYITNLIETGFPFTGVIEVSNLTGTGELGGHHMVMLPRYEAPDSAWFEKTDAEIEHAFLHPVKKVWPDLDDNLVRATVHRARRVQAIWISDPPPSVIQPPHNQARTLWNVNAELSGRDTLNNNAVVRVAESVLAEVMA